jgi:hypothetical protein
MTICLYKLLTPGSQANSVLGEPQSAKLRASALREQLKKVGPDLDLRGEP